MLISRKITLENHNSEGLLSLETFYSLEEKKIRQSCKEQ